MFSSHRQFFSSSFARTGSESFSREDLLSSVLQGLKQIEAKAMKLHPPEWVVNELTGRLILLINHILLKEPQAMDRLKRQKGRTIEVRWHQFACRVSCTPAGLIEWCQQAPLPAQTNIARAPDLSIELMESSLISLMQMFANSEKPPLHIQGNVQLAAEVNWLVDHVRWDLEDDLAKLIGDVNAHQLGKGARYVKDAMVKFVALAKSSLGPSKDGQPEAEGQAR